MAVLPTPPVEIAKINIGRLSKTVKFRIIDELKASFRGHPVFKDVEQFIQNKFAFEERPSFGIVVKNISGDLIKLSPDNFLGTIVSHVYLARVQNYEGRSIEWVREDIENILVTTSEDVSSQFDGTIRTLQTTNFPLIDARTGEYAEKPFSVRVTINGVLVLPLSIMPLTGQIILEQTPRIGTTVNITYAYRVLEPQGIYFVEITGSNQFVIDPVYVIENASLTDDYDGSQTIFQLPHYPLFAQTVDVWRDDRIELIKDQEYTVDAQTGILTLINPSMPSGTILTVSYKYPGVSRGPYPLIPERSNNLAIKGVVLAFERGIKEGDKQAVIIRNTREHVAQAYGGKWDFSISLDVYAKDPIQREELTDLTLSILWEGLKPRLDREGFVIKNVSHNGESEEVYNETSGEQYYLTSITLNMESDWELHQPLPFSFRKFDYVLGGEMAVRQQGGEETSSIQLREILPDENPVLRVGFKNFERLSS